jgi:tripartite-type tricarboxylate transporter receptor subunit TctC
MAQYPSRPVHLYVPFAQNGAADLVARALQPGLSAALGQPVIVANIPGQDGYTGVETAAKSPPDGHTMLFGTVGTVITNPVTRKLPLDPLNALSGVTLVSHALSVLVVRESLPPKSIAELVAYAKANPGKLRYAAPEGAVQSRLEGEELRQREGLDVVVRPYRGTSAAVTAVASGEVDYTFTPRILARKAIESGMVKAFPAAEPAINGWTGIFVPAGTPDDVTKLIHKSVLQALQDPQLVVRLQLVSMDVATSESPQAFRAFLASERQRWSEVIKKAGLEEKP